MKTSTKVILGAYGAFVGAWLAGSAYFLTNSRSATTPSTAISGHRDPMARSTAR